MWSFSTGSLKKVMLFCLSDKRLTNPSYSLVTNGIDLSYCVGHIYCFLLQFHFTMTATKPANLTHHTRTVHLRGVTTGKRERKNLENTRYLLC